MVVNNDIWILNTNNELYAKAWVTWMMVDERICYFRFNQYMSSIKL